tara:strand:- start:34 stop:828 length:795 start_codon:yes stop_codon:yes gene_type:complete
VFIRVLEAKNYKLMKENYTMKSEFWKDWKRKSKLEIEGIKSLKAAKKIILENIPREEIIAIYVKGSFVRREMNKESDVDTFTILRQSKFLKKLKRLEEKYRDVYNPKIQFSGYSLWELKHNKRTNSGKKLRASPSRAVRHLEHYKIIYGKTMKKDGLNQGPAKGHLRGMVFAFRNIFLPGYNAKKFGFSEIVKQVFWLVENEEMWKGKNPPHSWKNLARSIKDKSHIVHDALKFRLHPSKDKKERARFIKKLNRYLLKLERLVE